MALGFGRVSAVAVRDLAPIPQMVPSDVEVRIATPHELDVVDQFVDEEAVFHAGSPIFRPYLRAATLTPSAVRAARRRPGGRRPRVPARSSRWA